MHLKLHSMLLNFLDYFKLLLSEMKFACTWKNVDNIVLAYGDGRFAPGSERYHSLYARHDKQNK